MKDYLLEIFMLFEIQVKMESPIKIAQVPLLTIRQVYSRYNIFFISRQKNNNKKGRHSCDHHLKGKRHTIIVL